MTPCGAGAAYAERSRERASSFAIRLEQILLTTRQTRHKPTFAVPPFEDMNGSTVELRVRLLGEGTDCSRPTKAINIGDGLLQLDAPNLYVAMMRGSKLLVSCSMLAKKPWIVPIPGTTKLSCLEENLGGASVELTAEGVHALEEASSKVKLEGARYSKFHEQLVGR